ncbi:hypothetical protein FSST1_009053 [Fusarium sambucinum]
MDPLLHLHPVIATKYHVAWPSLPSSPLGFKQELLPDIAQSQEIHKRVRDVLEKNSLIEEETTINFGHRYRSPTVLIYTLWHKDSDKTWKRAIEEMVTSVNKDLPTVIDKGFHFEMIAPQALMMSYPNDKDILWKKESKDAMRRHFAAMQPYHHLEDICTRADYQKD